MEVGVRLVRHAELIFGSLARLSAASPYACSMQKAVRFSRNENQRLGAKKNGATASACCLVAELIFGGLRPSRILLKWSNASHRKTSGSFHSAVRRALCAQIARSGEKTSDKNVQLNHLVLQEFMAELARWQWVTDSVETLGVESDSLGALVTAPSLLTTWLHSRHVKQPST